MTLAKKQLRQHVPEELHYLYNSFLLAVKRHTKMARSNKERAELKKRRYVYDRHLQQWIHHEDRDEYYRKQHESELIGLWILRIFVGCVLCWMFIMALSQ